MGARMLSLKFALTNILRGARVDEKAAAEAAKAAPK